MAIKGIFIDGCGFIEASLISKSCSLDEKVSFLVDTWASRTTLLDKDVIRLRIKYEKLTKSKSSLIEIGGSISYYILEDSTLIFRQEI